MKYYFLITILFRKLSLLVLLFLSVPIAAYSQMPGEFPTIGKNDLSEARFKPARYFSGEALFGYMNGGAELYLEYGISSALITEFDLAENHYKCEIFKMKGSEEAFGIFSASRYRCQGMPTFTEFTCQTRFQLQICKGPYYISIINKSGTVADSVNSLKIGEILVAKIEEPSVDLKFFLPDAASPEMLKNAVLVKGKLGVVNGAPLWEDYFKDISGYCAVIFHGVNNTIISVRFEKREAMISFLSLHNWEYNNLSEAGTKMSDGELVKLYENNKLLIESPN